jgi:NAD-dependent deacetylase
MLAKAEPNAAHHALAALEREGWVEAVVTQNIDMLHERAGSRTVIEVHGSIRTSSCLSCHAVIPFSDVVRLLEDAPAPLCPTCGNVLKPDVVMFGEPLPAVAIARASELACAAALALVVGSSLEVWPVAGLPLEAASFAIVNQGETALDDRAVLKIDAAAGETLAAVVELLA